MMKVETRKTAHGTEYWDAKDKRTVFVPIGKKPAFEETVNPTSMILGVDLESGKDRTVVEGEAFTEGAAIIFADMSIKELRAYAKDNGIQIPNKLTKQVDIAEFLNELTPTEGTEDDAE